MILSIDSKNRREQTRGDRSGDHAGEIRRVAAQKRATTRRERTGGRDHLSCYAVGLRQSGTFQSVRLLRA
jgi:hypothetical protein